MFISIGSFVRCIIPQRAQRMKRAWRAFDFFVQFMRVFLFLLFICVCVCMGRDKSRDVERTQISKKRKRKIYKNLWIFLFTNVVYLQEGGSVILGG